MGCAASSLHDNPAVSLCRHRCNFIGDALHHSYALADAHLTYSRSLASIAPILLRFFLHISADPLNFQASPPPGRRTSDSHIPFDSDSAEDGRDRHSEFFDQISSNRHYTISNNQKPESPPPAPTSSAWDFLNFFETFEEFEMAPYILSTEFKDVPVLCAEKNLGQIEKKIEAEKNVIAENEPSAKNTTSSAPSKDQIDVSQVMREVQIQFEKAAKSGNEVLKMLDVGRFRYQHKNSVYQVSSKLLHAVSEVCSESMEAKPSTENIWDLLDIDDEEGMMFSGNLSATLKQLCMWEKKLYDEVKAEEKLRMIHEKKAKQLKHLNEKGGEATHKVDEIQTLLKTICTKRKIAFQTVDQLSTTVSKLTDELLPWITNLIKGLFRMWKSMMEYHRCQHQVVAEANILDAIASDGKLNNDCLEVTVQLKFQIRNWILSFDYWIDVQRCFVKALNGWLSKCRFHEPEENADGLVPFSGSGVDAPPVFVLCEKWSKAMDKLSENEVIEAMEGFLSSVNQLLERYNKEVPEKVVADKDMERKLKMLEREEQKMEKIVQAREKKYIVPSGEKRGVPLSTTNLHFGLKHIFSAMESLAADSVQAYDQLLQVGIKEEENA